MSIGALEIEIAAKLPDYKKSPYSQYFYRYDFGACGRVGNAYDRCRTDNSFAGGIVDTGELYVSGGSVKSITIYVQQIFLEKVITAVTETYGKPVVDNAPTLQNSLGAKFEGRYMEWNTENTQLALTSSGREKFLLKIQSQEDVKEAKEQSEDSASKAAKDF